MEYNHVSYDLYVKFSNCDICNRFLYVILGQEKYYDFYGLDMSGSIEYIRWLAEFPNMQIDTNGIILPRGMTWDEFIEFQSTYGWKDLGITEKEFDEYIKPRLLPNQKRGKI
jgi:hypothetical protein